MGAQEYLCEFKESVFKISNVEKKTTLTIATNGSWTFVAPQTPELPSDYKGKDILEFITAALLCCPKA
jgi:hypothetical protein